MKNVTLLVVCLFGISISWGQTIEQWQQIGDELTLPSADYTTMELDHFGNAYYAYSNTANNSSLNVIMMDGTGWVQVGPLDFTSGAFIRNKAIAFDTLGVPLVAITDGTNNLTVLKLNAVGSDWDTVGIANFASTDGTNYRISMTMDSVSNQPVVAYRDFTTNKLCVQTFDGSNWGYMNSGQDMSVGSASLIDISSGYSDLIFVAYADAGKADTALVFQTHNSSAQWFASSNDSIASNGPVANISISVYDWYPSVAYINSTDNKVYLNRLSGAPLWYAHGEAIGNADFYEDLAIQRTGSNGNYGYVGFADTDALYGITTKRVTDPDFGTTNTELVDQAGFDGDTPFDIAFGLDSHDSLYVAFGSAVIGVKVYKLREISTAILDRANSEKIEIYPNPVSNDILYITTGLEKATVQLYSLSGQLIKENQINGKAALSISNIKPGSYIIQVFNEEVLVRRKLIIQ